MSSEEQDWNYRGNYNGQPVDPCPQVNMAIGPLDNSMANGQLQPLAIKVWTIDHRWPIWAFGH